MNRETTITIITPSDARITIKEMLEHIRKLDKRLTIKLNHSISAGRSGPTMEEIKALIDQRMKELRE